MTGMILNLMTDQPQSMLAHEEVLGIPRKRPWLTIVMVMILVEMDRGSRQ